jgi:nucleotide-binding universal stress UspA family protein
MSGTTVLCAVDLEAEAERVLATAALLAEKLGGRLRLLHVLPVAPNIHPDVLANPAAHPAFAAARAEKEAEVGGAMRALAKRAGLPASTVLAVGHGDAADVILGEAEAEEVGWIVIGTHARRGLARALLGSVATEVVRLASVPVVTVRAGAGDHPRPVRELPLDG